MLASRPGKQGVVEADVLRAEWTARAREAGFEALALPDGQSLLPGSHAFDVEAVIAEALDAVSMSASTWLPADLAREIAALLPAEASASQATPSSWCTAWPQPPPLAASSCTRRQPAASPAAGTGGR